LTAIIKLLVLKFLFSTINLLFCAVYPLKKIFYNISDNIDNNEIIK